MAAPAPREGATVLLVRDGGAGGLEVFLQRRALATIAFGGATVFPGGVVEPDDRSPEVEALCEDRTDTDASALLDMPTGGLGFWVAGIRECFEEAGVLFAHRAGEPPVSFADPVVADRFQAHRDALNARATTLLDVCRAEGLRLSTGLLHAFGHWITPVGPPKRFDTRFFVATLPDGQDPLHEGNEAISSGWRSPSAAIAAFDRGEIDLIGPTFLCLRAISSFDQAADLVGHAELVAGAPRVGDGGGTRILLPGEQGKGPRRANS